ncbi:hypothetical protein D0C36_20430 [Mucilaginibacter conchicola]|uniref:Uncharacterized protein n=1 Tax=Mucilaginibacter conchicola TaxID=2303333 RepID=A0A372NQS3_9SPHI|nr:hypothetical protein [Mucilaginibacter conchicola]RFZ91299.1 hypothetical protein D0C36_20430 [Mucilaginibacter conchicola]
MKNFNANASVIYTDDAGRLIDTFVIFDTDEVTGLTHINHENRRVPADRLALHSKTVCMWHLPLQDAFSFELLSKLKAKYLEIDSNKKTLPLAPLKRSRELQIAKAS